MSEAMPPDDEIDALAGEYVLGLLDAPGKAMAERLRRRDGRFDSAVSVWTARLIPLAEEVTPVAPPARRWRAIEAAALSRAPGPRANWKFWIYLGLGAAASALTAAALAVLVLHPSAPTPLATARLATPNNGVFIATEETSAAGIILVVNPAGASVPAGKSDELWLLLPAQKPRALGLLSAQRPLTALLAAALRRDQAVLAISLEPPGGSPSGAPTGPVIATAKFS